MKQIYEPQIGYSLFRVLENYSVCLLSLAKGNVYTLISRHGVCRSWSVSGRWWARFEGDCC